MFVRAELQDGIGEPASSYGIASKVDTAFSGALLYSLNALWIWSVSGFKT